MQRVQVVCDLCERVKGDTNHWWQIRVCDDGSLHLRSFIPTDDPKTTDLCSSNCAIKVIDKFMMDEIKKSSPLAKTESLDTTKTTT